MTAAKLLAEVRAHGVAVHAREDGSLGLRPAGKLPPDLREALRSRRDDVIAYLRDPQPERPEHQLSDGGKLCATCRSIDRCLGNDRTGYVCLRCAEWTIAGCATFTALSTTDDQEAAQAACIACGGGWTLHGSPDPMTWRRVHDPEDVGLVATRFVVASARAIASGARR